MDVTCVCGTAFTARHPRARYCSDRCRKRGQRAAPVVELPARPADDGSRGRVEQATYRDLEAAGRLESSTAEVCLTLARRLDNPGVDTGSALATLAGRLDDLMAKATRGAGKATAPQQLRDELAVRRARHA